MGSERPELGDYQTYLEHNNPNAAAEREAALKTAKGLIRGGASQAAGNAAHESGEKKKK